VTRIISGAFGGRRLDVPAGVGTRPTSDRVREALFGRLDHQDVLSGARVLDLYAGSGALGLEAVSRGAAAATFVEQDRPTAEVLRRNVAALVPAGEAGQAGTPAPVVDVVVEPVQRALLRGTDQPYDVVLADPPYPLAEDDLADVLALLPQHGWLSVDALVVVERSARSPEPRWPARLARVDERRYGETRLWWARAAGAPDVA
jgi:16S rRNA (guanine966-N2)-methyltransferase